MSVIQKISNLTRVEKWSDIFTDGAAALSLSNLFFLKTWQEIVFAAPEERFYLKTPAPADYYAVLLNVLFLGILIFFLFRTYRKSHTGCVKKPAAVLFVGILLVPLNAFRNLSPALSIPRLAETFGDRGLIAGAVLLLLLAAGLSVRYHRSFIHGLSVVLLVLSSFSLLTFSQAAWSLVNWKPLNNPSDFIISGGKDVSNNRVLWLVFDELDQRMTFEEHPLDVKTPELDRLLRQSLFATQAFAPGEETIVSMPALITGRKVVEAQPAGPEEILLTFENQEKPVPWSRQPGIFSRLDDLGYKTAVVGCYLPYDRVIGHHVTTCFWQPFGTTGIKGDSGIIKTMKGQVFSALALSPFNNRYHARDVFQSLLKHAKQIVVNPEYKLILVHMTIPHYPWIYDREQEDFTLTNFDLDKGYYDNLVLVDLTINRLRLAMEKSGTWENTHVIVTSDHPWRMERFPVYDREFDPRIPFVLQVAGQEEPLNIDYPFNTVITTDLILALVQGQLSTPEEVKRWIRMNR